MTLASRGNWITRSSGYTLAEMLGVVLVLAIAAAAVVPTLTQSDKSRIELATSEVAGVLRFARDEARRLNAHTVVVLSDHARLQAFELDVSDPDNPKLGPPLRHPVGKDIYDIDLHVLSFTEGVKASTNLPEGSQSGVHAAAFNPRGQPVSPWTLAELPNSYIDVNFGQRTLRVRIWAVTARIDEKWQ